MHQASCRQRPGLFYSPTNAPLYRDTWQRVVRCRSPAHAPNKPRWTARGTPAPPALRPGASCGARWGRIRLYNDKSLLGSAVFFAAGSIVSTIYLALAVAPMSPLRMIAIATSVSLVGTVVELFSDRLDDNFTIPVTCAAMAMLWF